MNTKLVLTVVLVVMVVSVAVLWMQLDDKSAVDETLSLPGNMALNISDTVGDINLDQRNLQLLTSQVVTGLKQNEIEHLDIIFTEGVPDKASLGVFQPGSSPGAAAKFGCSWGADESGVILNLYIASDYMDQAEQADVELQRLDKAIGLCLVRSMGNTETIEMQNQLRDSIYKTLDSQDMRLANTE